jgi:hypothetical protein
VFFGYVCCQECSEHAPTGSVAALQAEAALDTLNKKDLE